MLPASRHAVLIPSYNSGKLLFTTVAEALSVWPDVIVVVDGSTDDSESALSSLTAAHPGLEILKFARNRGGTWIFSYSDDGRGWSAPG